MFNLGKKKRLNLINIENWAVLDQGAIIVRDFSDIKDKCLALHWDNRKSTFRARSHLSNAPECEAENTRKKTFISKESVVVNFDWI